MSAIIPKEFKLPVKQWVAQHWKKLQLQSLYLSIRPDPADPEKTLWLINSLDWHTSIDLNDHLKRSTKTISSIEDLFQSLPSVTVEAKQGIRISINNGDIQFGFYPLTDEAPKNVSEEFIRSL